MLVCVRSRRQAWYYQVGMLAHAAQNAGISQQEASGRSNYGCSTGVLGDCAHSRRRTSFGLAKDRLDRSVIELLGDKNFGGSLFE